MNESMTKDENKMYDNHNIIVTNKWVVTGDTTYKISKILSVKIEFINHEAKLIDKFSKLVFTPLIKALEIIYGHDGTELKNPHCWKVSIIHNNDNIPNLQK